MYAGATVEDLPITEVDGKKYHYYEVQPRETIYGLSNKLGMSRDEMLRYNPSLVDGLKAGQKLLFPAKDGANATAAVTDSDGHVHKVERGETIYGLSNRYGLTVDEFIELNPSVKDGLKTGQTVKVSRMDLNRAEEVRPASAPMPAQRSPVMPSQAFAAEEDVPATTPEPAVADDVTVPTILPPGTPGQTLASAPEPDVPAPTFEDAAEETPVQEESAVFEGTTVVNTVTQPYPASLAVLLPFELSTSQPSKQARRYLEFYKGLLMAVDTLSMPNAPITIRAFDTSGGIQSVLTQPGLEDVQAIVGPGSEEDLAILAPWAAGHGVTVLNTFVVKDDTYLENPYIMQCNTPQKQMYERAVRELVSRFDTYTPVFLMRNEGPDERSEFVELARSEFMQKGIMPKDIVFDDDLSDADLQALEPMVPYLFIPVTGKQTELNKILPALVELHDQRTAMGDVALFGYPEWITFRGETLKNMQRLNTVVFSRFFNDTEDPDSRAIENRFYDFYGTEMEKAIPRQAILGFDTGRFAIEALRANNGDFKSTTPQLSGLQNGYRVSHAGSRGMYNDAVYFITYRPSGLVVREFLR